MAEDFHRPVLFDSAWFQYFAAGNDPSYEVARETAWLLLSRMHETGDEETYQRLLQYIDGRGIDELAEIWSHAPQPSLPAALWRIYLIRTLIIQDAASASVFFRSGFENTDSSDLVIAGAAVPAGPEEITKLTDEILRGVFVGDLSVALHRAAAFARVCSVGATQVADSTEPASPARASVLTKRALRFSKIAKELVESAKLWEVNQLD